MKRFSIYINFTMLFHRKVVDAKNAQKALDIVLKEVNETLQKYGEFYEEVTLADAKEIMVMEISE